MSPVWRATARGLPVRAGPSLHAANRVEVTAATGTGKLKPAGGVKGMMKESIQRAFSYLLTHKSDLGIAREVDTSDFHVESIDLLGNQVEAEAGVAFFIACYSAIKKSTPQPAMLVLQVAMDNGARRALIPLENRRDFLEVSADVAENVDPIFYGDLRTAAFKALGLS